MQVELFFESSASLWNRKWNFPHNLKFQLSVDCHSLEGTSWELVDMGQAVLGKSVLWDLSQNPPNFPNTKV